MEIAAEVWSWVGRGAVDAIAMLGGPETAQQRAGLVSSQLLGLALCRYILRFPPVVAMSRDEIVMRVGPVLQRYATGAETAAETRS